MLSERDFLNDALRADLVKKSAKVFTRVAIKIDDHDPEADSQRCVILVEEVKRAFNFEISVFCDQVWIKEQLTIRLVEREESELDIRCRNDKSCVYLAAKPLVV